MKELDPKYATILDNIKGSIQNSDLLKAYLDDEEDEQYNALKDSFEPEIHTLYDKVARENPLQVEAFENYLLNEQFEGLYLPKVLGYSVLRAKVDENVKFVKIQNHFKKVLNYIVNSSNFEQIKNRVGQSIQIGFALSSDIWISNFFEGISNKKVQTYLNSQKIDKYRNVLDRRTALVKYRKQFESLVFSSADFPKTVAELRMNASTIKSFLRYRVKHDFDNSTLEDEIRSLINNKDLRAEPAYAELLTVCAMHYGQGKEQDIKSAFDSLREDEEFEDWYFENLLEVQSDKKGVTDQEYKNLSIVISKEKSDKVSAFFGVMDTVLSKGFVHEDSVETIRNYYNSNEGKSNQNAAVRGAILSSFEKVMSNLPEESYADYFEINKTFGQYMDIFSNQKFNQDVKALSLKYVKRLLKQYIDKRGKDYQDIKKFVRASFLDFNFMTDKQLVELFKTKRKKKPTA